MNPLLSNFGGQAPQAQPNGMQEAIKTLQMMREKGMTPDQAYQMIMSNPNIAQRVRNVQSQFQNKNFSEIAKKNGINVNKFF